MAWQIAKLVKTIYKRKARRMLLDRSPWYKLFEENSDEKDTE